jgi:phosphate starvation-inducible PhoH-like protein
MSKRSKAAKKQLTQPQQITPSHDKTPYVFQRDKIGYDLAIRELPWTEKQKQIISLFLDKNTKMLILKGCAGTSKTTLAMYCGLQLLKEKRVSDLVLIRTAVESADSKLGFLPGTLEEKYEAYIAPFNDKFQELLPGNQIEKLQKDNRLTACPVNFVRGLHFAAKFVCCDEIQNATIKEIHTLVSRVGEFSKVFMCGDPEQSDINGRSGFNAFYDAFNNEDARNHGIYCIELGEEDIVRSEFCKYITKIFKTIKH